MTTDVDVVNRALLALGSRNRIVTLADDTVEAAAANSIYAKYRDQLLRMAPWNCGMAYANLIYLTSQPGTPENTSPYTPQWTPGQPPLGWAYEYAYPDDCLRACFVLPSMIQGFAGGVPIYPVPTGLNTAPTLWGGPAIRFKVQLDQYLRQATAIAVVAGGAGFDNGDTLICGGPPVQGSTPAGLVNVRVTGASGGVIVTAVLQPFTNSKLTSLLYTPITYPLSQVATSGIGTGASISISAIDASAFVSSRVILTNQEYATLAYVKQVTDPNVMDEDFIEAWVNVLAAGLCMPLNADKQQATMAIQNANNKIAEARKADGNEGLTVNDVTPDWIRTRGINFAGDSCNAWNGFDWGPLWPNP